MNDRMREAIEDVNIAVQLFLSLMNRQSTIRTDEDNIYYLSVSTTKSNVLLFISNSTLFNSNSSNKNLYCSAI